MPIPLTNIEYVTWTNEAESILYTGVLTAEDETHCSILTNVGEMTIAKNDGTFTPATREEFEQANQHTTSSQCVGSVTMATKTPRTGTKTEKASAIISSMFGQDKIHIINALMSQLDITKSNANIYYSKIVA